MIKSSVPFNTSPASHPHSVNRAQTSMPLFTPLTVYKHSESPIYQQSITNQHSWPNRVSKPQPNDQVHRQSDETGSCGCTRTIPTIREANNQIRTPNSTLRAKRNYSGGCGIWRQVRLSEPVTCRERLELHMCIESRILRISQLLAHDSLRIFNICTNNITNTYVVFKDNWMINHVTLS